MWRKWAMAAIAYLIIVMVGYSVYASVAGPDSNPSNHVEME
jgi:hypothetical protein